MVFHLLKGIYTSDIKRKGTKHRTSGRKALRNSFFLFFFLTCSCNLMVNMYQWVLIELSQVFGVLPSDPESSNSYDTRMCEFPHFPFLTLEKKKKVEQHDVLYLKFWMSLLPKTKRKYSPKRKAKSRSNRANSHTATRRLLIYTKMSLCKSDG